MNEIPFIIFCLHNHWVFSIRAGADHIGLSNKALCFSPPNGIENKKKRSENNQAASGPILGAEHTRL